MARLTFAGVNKALKAEGINAELVQGEGYLYFVGDDVELAGSTSIYVCKLNHTTLDIILADAKRFKAEHTERLNRN